MTAAYKPISDLAGDELRKIDAKIDHLLKESGDKVDPYTSAHLNDLKALIKKVLNAEYIYNANALGGSAPIIFTFGKEAGASPTQQ